MDKTQPKFNWIAWLASVPGIPAGWGEATSGKVIDLPVRQPADQPERKAA